MNNLLNQIGVESEDSVKKPVQNTERENVQKEQKPKPSLREILRPNETAKVGNFG